MITNKELIYPNMKDKMNTNHLSFLLITLLVSLPTLSSDATSRSNETLRRALTKFSEDGYKQTRTYQTFTELEKILDVVFPEEEKREFLNNLSRKALKGFSESQIKALDKKLENYKN
jgi:hypothetical protein